MDWTGGIPAGARVLVAEDEYLLAMDVSTLLSDAGLTVVGPFMVLRDAVAAVIDEPPELALVDMNMRGEMSYALIDALVERDVPFILVTGYGAEMIPDDLAHHDRVTKPFTQAMLLAAVAEGLAPQAPGSVPYGPPRDRPPGTTFLSPQ